MKKICIERGAQIPARFGRPRVAVRKTTVRIREPAPGGEIFEKTWGTLTAMPDEDIVIVQDSGEEYPIKKDIFTETFEAAGDGRYRKIARSRLVQVPDGVVVVLKTLEGEIEVTSPDYVVVGVQDEVYANNPQWVEENLEFAD